MKILFKIAIILTALTTLNSQSVVYYSETSNETSDRDRLMLKQNVETLQRIRYDANFVKLDGANLWTTMNLEFNGLGNIIDELTYDENDVFMSHFIMEYLKGNKKRYKPLKKTFYDINDDIICEYNYSIDGNSRIIEIEIEEGNQITSIQNITYGDKTLTITVKDDQDVILLEELFNFDVAYNLIQHSIDQDTNKVISTFTHNGSKDILTAVHSKIQRSSILTYKSDVNLNFVYTYDGTGNWTRKDTYHDGVLKEIVTQSLTHF